MYQINSRVSHPLYGLGTIQKIEKKKVLGQDFTYAVVSFAEEGLELMVRADEENQLLRPVVEKSQVDKVFKAIEADLAEGPNRANWRQRVNLEKLKSNDIFQLGEVVKNLYQVRLARRKLNPKEESMLEKAWRVLLDELTAASGRERSALESRLERVCQSIPSERAAG